MIIEKRFKVKAVIYHNPRCSKSRNALKLLQDQGISVEVKLYLEKGINRSEILDILEMLNVDIKEILRDKEKVFLEKYDSMIISRAHIINVIVEDPILLQRPIVLFKSQGIGAIARSENAIMSLLEAVKQ